MKRALILAALVVFLITSIAVSQDEAQPKLVIPKTRHDFGKVFERESYAYSFKVRNRGQADLLINSVKPT